MFLWHSAPGATFFGYLKRCDHEENNIFYCRAFIGSYGHGSGEQGRHIRFYESGVNTKIAGLVKQHLVLVKENKDGSKEFNVYMFIDEAKAKKAREEAALAAKKQAALGVLSQQVEEFIGEPVEAE